MQIDEHDTSWRCVRAWAEAEIEQLRNDLEDPRVEWQDVVDIRAQLTRLRALLGLPKAIEDGRTTIDPERFDRI